LHEDVAGERGQQVVENLLALGLPLFKLRVGDRRGVGGAGRDGRHRRID
jgi:hypothetical protein